MIQVFNKYAAFAIDGCLSWRLVTQIFQHPLSKE